MKGLTPLHLAITASVKLKDTKAIQVLLTNGANFKIKV